MNIYSTFRKIKEENKETLSLLINIGVKKSHQRNNGQGRASPNSGVCLSGKQVNGLENVTEILHLKDIY